MPERMVRVEHVVVDRIARSQSLAVAGADRGHAVRPRLSHRDHLAPRRRGQRRLPGRLLLPGGPRTQERIGRQATGACSFAELATARTSAAGDRRLADQAVWAESRRCRCPSQPDTGSSRSAVPVRPCVGDNFAGAAASKVGARLACRSAGAALCSQANDGRRFPKCRGWQRFATKLQLAARLVEWIAPDSETNGKNCLDRDRWRLHQAAVLESGFERPAPRSWDACAGTQPCATCLRSSRKASAEVVAGRARMARTNSVWPNAPGKVAVGRPRLARSTAGR